MNKHDIEKEVLKIVTEQMGQLDGDYGMKTSREDIGSDSLDDIEIVMALEEYFEIDIEDDLLERVETIQDMADVVALAVGGRNEQTIKAYRGA